MVDVEDEDNDGDVGRITDDADNGISDGLLSTTGNNPYRDNGKIINSSLSVDSYRIM